MVFTLMFTMVAPVFAALPSTKSPEQQEVIKQQLVDIIFEQAKGVVGVVPEDWIKGLVETYIDDLIGGIFDLTGAGLGAMDIGGLANGLLSDLLGLDLSGSGIDVGGIVNGILDNDIVNGIITSDFVKDVVSRTIVKILAEMSFADMSDPIIYAMAETLAEGIWNNGNPTSTMFLGQPLGNWNNNTEEWVEWRIGAEVLLKLGGSLFGIGGSIDEYFDINNIDIMSMFDINVVLNAVMEAFVEVATEYITEWVDDLKQQAQQYIENFKAQIRDNIRNIVINEINNCLGTDIPEGTPLNEIEGYLHAYLHDYLRGMAQDIIEAKVEKICAKLQLIKMLSKNIHSEIHDCIGRIIECIMSKCGDDGTVNPIEIEITRVVTSFRIVSTPAMANVIVYVTETETDKATGAIRSSYEHVLVGNFTAATGFKGVKDIDISPTAQFIVQANLKGFPAPYTLSDFWVVE